MGIEQNTHRILNDFSRSSQFKNASYDLAPPWAGQVQVGVNRAVNV